MTFTRPQAGELLGNNNYRVTDKINEGIYHGISLISGKEVVINIESSSKEFYGRLAGGVGIPLVYCLGPCIGDLFKFCDYKFSTNTILLLASQLISPIEYIHDQSLIHGDLNPDNFCVGRHEFSRQVHVTNIHHDKGYQDPKTHKHFPSDNEKKWTGPAHYTIINTHLLTSAAEKSRRNDIESLGYIFLYIYRSSKEQYGRFKQVMMTTPIDDLRRDLPNELATYLNYARSLAFDDEPDYSYLRKIVRDCCIYEGPPLGIVYDWEVRKYQMQSGIVPMSQEQRKSEARDIYDEFLGAERKCKKSNEQASSAD
ncbi:kinase-like domain-containing protein [Leptodontidium sp. 2 PMI_412]|nr:kinase-like domain-containing protein [Leptodontidium sp. 2 PMI_412]